MKRILRNVFSYATCDARPRFFGDEILSADPVPKLLLMPMTWRGDLKPVLDAYLEQLRPLENGFTLGRTLGAQEVPATLNLGTAWLGSFRDRMLAARSDQPGALDATPVLAALEGVRRVMGVGDPIAVADGLRILRRAADRVQLRDDEPHGAFSEGRRIADAARHRIADINARNRHFHAAQCVTPQLDSSGRMNWRTGDSAPGARTTVFRDAAHDVRAATTPGARIEAMNRGARAFWSGVGDPPTVTADTLRRVAAPAGVRTPEAINAANRAFWDQRGRR
ncbi:MAG TPA: hypothetical protein VFX20_15885 [Steroidobacteraceae bacterium]|nr:hypothetical protein [Steroidobacteraceae bacterium]